MTASSVLFISSTRLLWFCSVVFIVQRLRLLVRPVFPPKPKPRLAPHLRKLSATFRESEPAFQAIWLTSIDPTEPLMPSVRTQESHRAKRALPNRKALPLWDWFAGL